MGKVSSRSGSLALSKVVSSNYSEGAQQSVGGVHPASSELWL